MQTNSTQRKRQRALSGECRPTVTTDKRARLRIVTDIPCTESDVSSIFPESSGGVSAVDSLFDEPTEPLNLAGRILGDRESSPKAVSLASRTAPPIPGLFAPSVRLPSNLADKLMQTCMDKYFRNGSVNQIMLFGRALPPSADGGSQSGIPPFLMELLSTISEMLLPELPARTHALLFPPPDAPIRARQAILNLYHPGEGISPHVDLLKRFGDGIVGISLGSGCVMSFGKESREKGHRKTSGVQLPETLNTPSLSEDEQHWGLYLPERSIVVLSEEARFEWTHGIQGLTRDFVRDEHGRGGEWIARGVRLSITFRWLLPGAEIVGEPDQ